MWNILIGLCFYDTLRQFGYNYGKDKKITDNMIGFFHIGACFFLTLCYYLFQYDIFRLFIVGNTCGYFLNDTAKYISFHRYKFSDCVLIYHHIVCTLYLYFNNYNENSYWLQALVWAELSNLSNKIVYYYIQQNRITGKYEVQLGISKKLQVLVYSFIRLFILSYYTIAEFLYIGLSTTYILCLPLNIMGYVWAYVIIKKDMENTKKIMK